MSFIARTRFLCQSRLGGASSVVPCARSSVRATRPATAGPDRASRAGRSPGRYGSRGSFLKDDDISGRLQDLDVVVVAARGNRQLPVEETAVVEFHVLRAGPPAQTPKCRHLGPVPPSGHLQPLRLVGLPVRRPGRQPAVRRIGDERCPFGRDADVPPELVEA